LRENKPLFIIYPFFQIDHPSKEGGLFVLTFLYGKKNDFFQHFFYNSLDFSLFFVIFVLKLKIRRNKQLYIKKIIIIKKVAIKIWICKKRLLYLKCERVETNKMN
jgi:hypothetical protein